MSDEIQRLHIAVIGDIMVDQYITGEVNRISPEAPVPVNLVKSRRSVLGGAANTAANLAALGCHVYLAGMRGNDQSGDCLIRLLKEAGIDDSNVMTADHYPTTTKIRVLGSRQQMIRLDFEEKKEPPKAAISRLQSWLNHLRENHLDSIVISDYDKGFITPLVAQFVIRFGREHEIPVLVDPKGNRWEKYDGAWGLTPNLKELSEGWGHAVANEDQAIETAGEAMRKRFHLSRLFVTRSEKGITCLSEEKPIHRASVAQDVFDVSGAGDTVMAVIAAGVGGGISLKTVIEMANTAAGIAVSKVGTYQVKREELFKEWTRFHHFPLSLSSWSWEKAEEQVKEWKRRGETVVFTNGCFDILHRGHITYLKQAVSLGDHLIIGLNSDASVRKLKGQDRPINKEEDRALMLSSLRFVDGVVIFNEDTPEKLLSVIRPDILVKGGDYKPEEMAGAQYAGTVKILSFVPGYSTTNIIQKIRRGKA